MTLPTVHPPSLLSDAGDAALERLLARHPLLVFDLDGTLAPIVPRPQDARVSAATSARLAELGQHLPVAVVTGRRVADARARLGFEPGSLIGSHGAEDEQDPLASARWRAALEPARRLFQQQRGPLERAGILVEDKSQSIALHYRGTTDPLATLAIIETLLHPLLREPSPLRAFGGKYVVNLVAADAPDKAHAVQTLLQRWGCDTAFFAGDDVNDEPVFAAAQPHWLTVRVGHDSRPTRARYAVASPAQLLAVLDRMHRLLG